MHGSELALVLTLQDHRQFKQRYYEFLDYFRAPNGPVFLYICGESSCNGISNNYLAVSLMIILSSHFLVIILSNAQSIRNSQFMHQVIRNSSNSYIWDESSYQVIAKKFGAALVSPEHRYYGKSSPFESLTTENLKFLSSKQALFDLAVFRQYYQVRFQLLLSVIIKMINHVLRSSFCHVKETLNAKYNRTGAENSWFVFGGSYAGALSAWFRLKFPHLTCGSLASSGVVLAIHNFTDFDKQVSASRS